MTTQEYLNGIIEALVKEDSEIVMALVSKALAEGMDPLLLVNEGLTAGLRKVGDLFADEEVFLPGLIVAGQTVTHAIEMLKPHLSENNAAKKKTLCLMATVQGDVHDIGKNLVSLLLSASGYEVVDLGKDVTCQTILDKVKELNPDILGLSTLLTTTMPEQKRVIEAIEEAGLRENIKILVGGSPVTRAWAKEIRADGYAEDCVSAVVEADRVIGIP